MVKPLCRINVPPWVGFRYRDRSGTPSTLCPRRFFEASGGSRDVTSLLTSATPSSEHHDFIGAEPSSGTTPQSRKPTSRPVGFDLDETHTPIRSQLEFDHAAGLDPKLIAPAQGW